MQPSNIPTPSSPNEVTALPDEHVILGIDPGTNIMGYGLLAVGQHSVRMLAMGVIDLHRVADPYLKLGRIHERILSVIEAYLPDELAIEAPFFGKNVQSMLKLGRAQGVVIAAAISRHIPIHEYAPMEIKQAITGRGAASKEQVAELMKRILCLTDDMMLPYLDATDALAAAYCHHLRTRPIGTKSRITPENLRTRSGHQKRSSTSWADFAKNNADRVHK